MGMKAEKSAEQLIAGAKQSRQARLKQAKEKAEEELKHFRSEQEAKFQREVGSKQNADPSAELSGATQAEAAAVKGDYQSNKDRTIKYIIDKVLDVPTGLTETQKQALKMGVV